MHIPSPFLELVYVFILTCLSPCGKVRADYESLAALNLIGSHFGLSSNATFDYVVVGGGTAGLALARRLAQNANSTVAIVEAGSFYELDNGNRSTIPAYGPYGSGNNPASSLINDKIDWRQYTSPQLTLNNQSIFYPSGKTLGGGSARNYQAYHRGTVQSYDRWADLVGDASYEFESFLPFFQKSVHFTPPPSTSSISYNSSSFSTGGGPLEVSYPSFTAPIVPFIEAAMQEAGLPASQGFSSGKLAGYASCPVTQDPFSQQRSSSETSFLREILEYTLNCAIYTNTLAKRILFDDSKNATGVLVESGGSSFALSANKEVILSAGAFRSPQLLLVSGIGSSAMLQELGIQIVQELPGVGQNMWDQPLFGPSYQVNVLTHSALAIPSFAQEATSEFIENRTGILTNGGGSLLAFEKLPADLRSKLSPSTRAALDTSFPPDWPEIEYLGIDSWEGLQQDSILGAPQDGKNYFTISACLLAPFSRGNVSINSPDTAIHPVVSPNWIEDPRDQEFAIQVYRRAREIFALPGIQPALVGGEAFPGLNVTTDEQILDVIRRSLSTIHHASSTCAMGRSDDAMAVIDSHARVFGVGGLRVVDASSFPLLPPGHPQATVYALAEKIAADIQSGN